MDGDSGYLADIGDLFLSAGCQGGFDNARGVHTPPRRSAAIARVNCKQCPFLLATTPRPMIRIRTGSAGHCWPTWSVVVRPLALEQAFLSLRSAEGIQQLQNE